MFCNMYYNSRTLVILVQVTRGFLSAPLISCYSLSKIKLELPEIGGSEDTCCITKKYTIPKDAELQHLAGYVF